MNRIIAKKNRQRTTRIDRPYRVVCYRCFRARSVCICHLVPTINNRTGVTIIQHHREQRHPIGTARIARLSLQNSRVVVAQRSNGLAVECDLPVGAGLLWPHPQALDLELLEPAERPKHLVVLDGTWSQAKRLYRSNAWLNRLPHFVINPDRPSQYRIRRQPRRGCLSTVEALVEALQLIEPPTPELPDLLDVFERMVEHQISCAAQTAVFSRTGIPRSEHPAPTDRH